MEKFKHWVNAFRPWTYPAAIVPVALGATVAYTEGYFTLWTFILTLIGGILLQSGSNLINTYGDYKAGVDNVENSVKSPELVRGYLNPKDVYKMAIATFVLAGVLGVILSFVCGWEVILLGLIGVFFAYSYTAGVSYKYMGLGLIAVFISMGVIMVVGGYFVQTSEFSWLIVLLSIPNAFQVTATLSGNELRDYHADREAGITTFAGRFSYKTALRIYQFLNIIPFVITLVFVLTGIMPWQVLIAFIALIQLYKNLKTAKIATSTGDKMANLALVPNCNKIQTYFGLLMCLGYIISVF